MCSTRFPKAGARRRAHMPIAFLRLLQSLQYFGQVIPAGTFPAALSAFQSLPQARSRAYSACRPSAGLVDEDFAAGFWIGAAEGAGAAAGVAVAGFADSALHLATYAFSVIFLAWFSALLALHSSWHAAAVFCASDGVAEKAMPETITAEHTISAVRDVHFSAPIRCSGIDVFLLSHTGGMHSAL